nr:4772_t:CDS:2 [Entrophospora candida]
MKKACTAHVLQLTINKALGTIKPYVKRFKKLIKFFTSSPKQTERNVAAVKTRWNASYNSWIRLLKLQKSIEWLANTLAYEPGKDSKSDAHRLKYLLLKNYKWGITRKNFVTS